MTDFPAALSPRPLWLVTLADLALLLVGFLVLIQATAAPERAVLGRSLREAFGAEPPAAMPVAAFAVRFETGSTVIADPGALVAWTREAVRDPRVALSVTGATDGTRADVDPASGGPALLASDRARAVAAALAGIVPSSRLRLATDPVPRGRVAAVTLAFAGDRP